MRSIDFDLYSRTVQENPYPFYRRLRSAAPICHFPEQDMWTVSRWADVVDVLRRPDLFSSSGRTSFEDTLLGADPPAHTRTRKLLNPSFAADATARLETGIKALVHELIDRFAAAGSCDFMAEFARPFPLQVVADLMGIERDDCKPLAEWANDASSGDVVLTDAERNRVETRRAETDAFFERYVQQCQHRAPRGMFDRLLQSERDEERLSSDAVRDLAKLMVIAGSETTTNLLGNGLLALLRAPDQLVGMAADPSRIPLLIEETLRYDSPAQNVKRRATRDVQVSGITIPTDALVLVLIASANRDDAHFDDPDSFVVGRQPNDHVAFGLGPHFCIGARLARLEAKIAFEALFERLDELRPIGRLNDIPYLHSTRIRGPVRLDIAFRQRAAA